MSHVMVATKVCENPPCGVELSRRPNESYSRFNERQYCSRRCAGLCDKSRVAKARALRKAADDANREYVIGELKFLLGTDSDENLARRLGYTNVKSLIRVLRRWGQTDLVARLAPPVLDDEDEEVDCW